jgi:hypothetical protein
MICLSTKFPVGTRVEDRETKARGVVVHTFSDATLKDVCVVRWGASDDGVAVPIDTIREYKVAPIAKRRRGATRVRT